MGPIGCPETSVINYHYSLCNNPRRALVSSTARLKPEITHCWRRYLALRDRRWHGSGDKCTAKSFMVCTPHQIFGWSRRMKWAGHVARIEERSGPSGCGWEELREGDHWVNLDVDGRIMLKWVLRQSLGRAWSRMIWLNIGIGGRLLWTRLWTFGFHTLLGICWLSKKINTVFCCIVV